MIRFIQRIYSLIVKTNSSVRLVFLNAREGISICSPAKIHSGAVIRIWKGGTIDIAANCEVMPGAMILTYGGKITIGENCSINPYCIIYGHGGLTIGNNVMIAGGTMIIPNNHIFKDATTPITRQGNDSRGITIDDDVWIGHGCSILDGVHIGKGSVVAAGSVVTKNIQPYSVVAGVPARVIKSRQ